MARDHEELPTPVDRVHGAAQVAFPWALAREAVEALRAMADELEDQWATREPAMVDRIGAWEGAYRDEFDMVHADIRSRCLDDPGVAPRLRRRARDIVDGAHHANRDQQRRNDEADELDGIERDQRELLRAIDEETDP